MRSHLAFSACLTLLLATASVQADMIIFKDGFILHGKVSRDGETIADPGGQAFTVPKGPFFILDGARRISFSFLIVEEANKKDIYQNVDLVRVEQRLSRHNPPLTDPLVELLGVSEWNDRWERVFTLGAMRGAKHWKIPIEQRLGMLSPHFVRIDARSYNWSSYHLSGEFKPEVVRSLLYNHAEFRLKGDQTDFTRRLRVYRFLAQAGWYPLAEEELASIAQAFPKEHEKLVQAREHLHGLKAFDLMDRIEQAHKAGRHRWTLEQLAAFPRADVDERVLARKRLLDDRYATSGKALEQARRHLKELTGRLALPFQQKLFGEAADVIAAELNHDNVARLEAFLKLAEQAEVDRRQDKPSENGASQLLALAVTGWLLGKDSAENKIDSAQRLWRTRLFLLDYLQTADAANRERLLGNYLKQKRDSVAVDELAQMIAFLSPIAAGKDTSAAVVELKTAGPRKSINYLLQLPPEYQHSRAYPVLFALHQAGETPRDMLQRCAPLAAQHGYILAVPEWQQELGPTAYTYSPEEHAAVTHVLHDLRRRFQVDSDRVFLLGYGEGGAMAYDVGLSHPDLFAGVLPVSASWRLFSKNYLHNGQFLPFYVVNGTHAGELAKQNLLLFEKWLPEGYPSLHVEYKGRGLEWFDGELPFMFDWMSRKKRAGAFPTLGRHEFSAMRPTDNRFYWIRTGAIREIHLNDPRAFRAEVSPATLLARIGEGNQIGVTTRGFRQLTLCLGRDPLGRDMIDFAKPVTVRVNGAILCNNKPAKPDLATLLEDLHEHADRQRLVLLKLAFELK